MFSANHCGLTFTPDHIKRAQANRKRDPLQDAWNLLNKRDPLDLLESTQWNALRWRFSADNEAGAKALANLDSLKAGDGLPLTVAALARTLTIAQCVEMLRDHPAWDAATQNTLFDALAAQQTHFDQAMTDDIGLVEKIWLATLNIAVGIVLETEATFEQGTTVYRQVIENSIHPQGHISEIVEASDGFTRFLVVVKALILCAEMAAHVGVDLWSVNNRGVSVTTAAMYPLYYYYYPEKWQWNLHLTAEDSQGAFQSHGSYLEILNHHLGRKTQAIDLILQETRPVYDSYGGGLTTLTHGVPIRRGLFG